MPVGHLACWLDLLSWRRDMARRACPPPTTTLTVGQCWVLVVTSGLWPDPVIAGVTLGPPMWPSLSQVGRCPPPPWIRWLRHLRLQFWEETVEVLLLGFLGRTVHEVLSCKKAYFILITNELFLPWLMSSYSILSPNSHLLYWNIFPFFSSFKWHPP